MSQKSDTATKATKKIPDLRNTTHTASDQSKAETPAEAEPSTRQPIVIKGNARLRRWRGWWITGVIVVAVIALGVVPAALLANSYFGRHHLGDTVQIGTSWTVAFTHLSTAKTLDKTPAAPGHVFLVIDVSVRNISNQSQSLSDLSFYGPIDSSGKNYPASLSLNGTVAPGVTEHGTLVAEIPTSLHKAILEVDDQNEDSFSNIWDITIPSA
jgi:hypothetical protein